MSIYISVASYRDPELMRTLTSAINNADNPKDLHFGIFIQDLDRLIPNFDSIIATGPRFSIEKIHPKLAQGAGYARAKLMEMYDGEDYFLQIDSHTQFTKGWDTSCIKQLKRAQELSGNNKIILSAFPQGFIIESGKILILNSPEYLCTPKKHVLKLNKKQYWTAERNDFKGTVDPEISTTVLAGFIFTTGNIVKEVPYDPEISFFGEELCFAARAWTKGWDIYSPNQIILYHFYTRPNYDKIWKDRNLRQLSWKELEEISKDKQKRVLCGIESGIYGVVGNIRSISDFEKMVGVDFKQYYGLTKADLKDIIKLEDGK